MPAADSGASCQVTSAAGVRAAGTRDVAQGTDGTVALPGTPVQHPERAKVGVWMAVLHLGVTLFYLASPSCRDTIGTVAAGRGSREELVAHTSHPAPLGAHTPRAGEIWHSRACWSQGSGKQASGAQGRNPAASSVPPGSGSSPSARVGGCGTGNHARLHPAAPRGS